MLRDPLDLERLTAAYLRCARVRHKHARAKRQQRESGAVRVPTATVLCPCRQGESSDQPGDEDLLAVSYIRVEPVEAREVALAVNPHRSVIAAAARRLGLRLTEQFADIGYSGLGRGRPGLSRLLDHVASRQVGYCIVASLDRFSENPEDASDIDEALAEARVAIVVASQHIDGADE